MNIVFVSRRGVTLFLPYGIADYSPDALLQLPSQSVSVVRG